MVATKKGPVLRVTGLGAMQPDEELAESLKAAISNNLTDEEKLKLDVRVAVVPSCYDDEERVALVECRGGLPTFLSELTAHPLSEWQMEMDDTDINFDQHFFGFTQLYTPKPATPVVADVIAITGLDGHAYGSWRGKGSLGRMWLRDFLRKDLPCCRTMIYGYNSKLSEYGVDTIMDYGRGLQEELKKVRCTEQLRQRPLFFVAHSFGGIILAHCLVKAVQTTEDDHPTIAALHRATYGMLLFGIPHRGLIIDDIQQMLVGKGNHPRRGLLEQIKQKSDLLAAQLDSFKNLVRDRKLVSFYETEQTRQLQFDSGSNRWKRTGDFVTAVDSDSALLQLPDSMEEKIPLDTDHSMMVKFDNKNARGYSSVRDKLRKFTEDAPSVVASRFVRAQNLAEQEPVFKPFYCIPFLKNRHFVGRRDELAVLRQRLLVAKDCQKMSIVGLGGTGKTQVALQFAYAVKEACPDWSIFWVPAMSMESFERTCTSIVQALHIRNRGNEEEDPKELVKQYLSSSRARRWLMVVDNADDPDILFGIGKSEGIVTYLPESEGGLTVYTTRTPEVTQLTPGDVIELGAMSRQDATDFLTKSLDRKDLLHDNAARSELLDELTDLPLAIAQAAAYLNRHRMPVSKYLQLLRNTEQSLVQVMSREFYDGTRYKGSANAVATTWVVSFSQIRKYDAIAAKLLGFISCVEWKAIPRSLLPRDVPEAQMEEAIGTLCGYSFLAGRYNDGSGGKDEDVDTAGTNGDERWFDMHRLVHLATRIWINKHGKLAEVTDEAVRHVTKIFPSNDYANQQIWRAYIPHALRLLRAEQNGNIEESSTLCLWVGRCLRVEGRIHESVKWLEKCYSLRSKSGKQERDLLFAQHELARAYQADGQVKKAVELLEAVVEVQTKVLKPDHPSRLASQHALAGAYQADGQVKKGVVLSPDSKLFASTSYKGCK